MEDLKRPEHDLGCLSISGTARPKGGSPKAAADLRDCREKRVIRDFIVEEMAVEEGLHNNSDRYRPISFQD